MAMRNEEQIRKEATLAMAERNKLVASSISQLNQPPQSTLAGRKRDQEDDMASAMRERESLRNERNREIERQRRLEVAGKKDTDQNKDRDISEKIALGQAQPSSKESMYDQRLFNQTSGLESGYGEEDDYALYDKPLFAD